MEAILCFVNGEDAPCTCQMLQILILIDCAWPKQSSQFRRKLARSLFYLFNSYTKHNRNTTCCKLGTFKDVKYMDCAMHLPKA